jgi:predicted lipoprotein with Yx(FWY)xxD motif
MAGRVRIALVTTVGAALLASYALSAGAAGAAGRARHSVAHTKNEGAKISLRHTSRGKFLVDANGHSLYTFSSDTKNHSRCGPACRKTWPPVTTNGKPKAGTGVSASHLRVIKGHQVTYYGHPLYTFFKDTKAGQTKGEGLFKFGGYWYLSSARGSIV